MSRVLRRLRALETHALTETDHTVEAIAHLCWWSTPIAPGELRQFCLKRAEERYIATVRGGRRGEQSFIDPGWFTGGVSDEERRARLRFESDELDRLQAVLGDELGWEAWHDQARDWFQVEGQLDAAALERRLLHAFTTADGNRAHRACPLWCRVWPEWKPGMMLAEHLAFDELLHEHGKERCARARAAMSGNIRN